MRAHKIIDKRLALQLGAVCGQHLGVIGHHRAVIVVVAQALVKVIAHAGVKNSVYVWHFGQFFHMAVRQLCRVAHGVGGDGSLPGQIGGTGGKCAAAHPEAQLCEQRMPEGKQLVKAEAHGHAHNAARACALAVLRQQRKLVGIQVQRVIAGAVRDGPVAAVAGNKTAPAREGVYR